MKQCSVTVIHIEKQQKTVLLENGFRSTFAWKWSWSLLQKQGRRILRPQKSDTFKKGKSFEPLPWLGVKIQLGNHMAPFPLHSHMGSPMLGMWTARQWLSADPPLLLIKISSQHHCHGHYLLLHLLLPTIHWDQLSSQSPQLLCSMQAQWQAGIFPDLWVIKSTVTLNSHEMRTRK